MNEMDQMSTFHEMVPPRTAYVLLWFPLASETFIYREVVQLKKLGLPLMVFSLYGNRNRDLSLEMDSLRGIDRLGIVRLKQIWSGLLEWRRKEPLLFAELNRKIAWRWWGSWERTGENLWAFLCGFHLAGRFLAEGIEHIHAPWAGGPATAAWVASLLTGIPFSFSGRAADIYPKERAIEEKIADCAFLRLETVRNQGYLASFAKGDTSKIHTVYNGLTLSRAFRAAVSMKPPFKLLALGRFVAKKGFDVLLHSCRLLLDAGMSFRLTLAGSGRLDRSLKALCRKLGLESHVAFPGFVQHDRVGELFMASDVFVMPSVIDRSGDRDGFPTVIVEALCHGLPVVATDIAGIGEIIRNGETGLLIDSNDPVALAEALVRMTRSRKDALRMAENGRALVTQMCDPERNGRKMLDLFMASSNRC